jgi:hypothetical protein
MVTVAAKYIDLNQYSDYLTPYKRERNCYHCPVCKGKLSVSKGNGRKFTCYGGNCDRSDIRKAVLALAGEDTSYSQEFLDKREAREQARAEAERDRLAKLQTETERDRNWRGIIDRLFLSDRHRQEMVDRGWTPEQIELSKARSSVKGRIIPIVTATGLIVGSQVIAPEGKRWYGTGANHLKETKELPLTVVYPAAPRAGIIAYTESTLDKPHLCAHRWDLVTIGSSNIGSQPNDLKRSIATIKERMGWDSVSHVLMADGGAVVNKHVLANYRKLNDQLEALGERLAVGWWGQLTKPDGDIDEIDPATDIEYLTPDRFFKTADRQLRAAEDRKLYATLSQLIHKPDQTRDEAYLSALPFPRGGSFQFVSSPCGTGKTEQLAGTVDNWLRANPQGRIIDLTHRNSIKDGHQRRLNIPEYKVGYGQNQAALNYNQKVSICLDSLLLLDLNGIPAGSLVILDEMEAILSHLTKGGTLGGNTAKVQAHFARLIDRVLATGGAVIGLEDSITDLAINGLLDLTERKYPHELIVNTHERFNWDVRLGGGSVDGFLAEIIDRLKAGERIIVPTTSQRFGEALERLASEEIPELADLVHRLDAKTAPEQHDFLNDPNAWLAANPTRLLILSPTVESGCSIDGGYFDRRMAYFVNLGTRNQIQLLHRNRDNIPTDIYIKERGAEVGNACCDPKKLLKVRANIANTTALAQGHGRIKLDLVGAVFNRLDAEFTARDTLSSNHLREYLEADLAARGHQIERVDWDKDSQLGARFKQIKVEIEVEENRVLAEADGRSLSPEQVIAILHSSGTTFERRQQATKTLLHRDLPGAELTEEFLLAAVTKDRGRYRRECELSWLLIQPELATRIDREIFNSQLESPHVLYSRVPKNRQKVDLLCPIVGDLEDLASGREYAADDPALVAIQEFALKNSYLFWALFGLKITPETIDSKGKKQNSSIATANKILKKLGYSTDSRQSGGRDEVRVRIYRVTNTDCPHRQTIYQALDLKYREFLKSAEAEGVHTVFNTGNSNLKTVCTGLNPPTPPPDRLADLQSMAAALGVLGSIEGEDELEALADLYAIWSPEDMAAASRLLKTSDPQAFDRLGRLVAKLKRSKLEAIA